MTAGARHPRIIVLWSAPRSRSTAFLRMMAARGDFTVLHEPFSQLADFGAVTIDERTVRTETELLETLRGRGELGSLFVKDTTDFRYPGLLADRAFLRDHTHTFLIRRPAEIIASHYALNRYLRRDEVGIERLVEIYDAVLAAGGAVPAVVSADDLVVRPGPTVSTYCAAVGIPFLPRALSWPTGLLPEWRRTRRWHEATGRTRGFTATASAYRDTVHNNATLARYHAYHLPFYERLYRCRLIVGPQHAHPAISGGTGGPQVGDCPDPGPTADGWEDGAAVTSIELGRRAGPSNAVAAKGPR